MGEQLNVLRLSEYLSTTKDDFNKFSEAGLWLPWFALNFVRYYKSELLDSSYQLWAQTGPTPEEGIYKFQLVKIIEETDEYIIESKTITYFYMIFVSRLESNIRMSLGKLNQFIKTHTPETTNNIILIRKDWLDSFDPHGGDPDIMFDDVVWHTAFHTTYSSRACSFSIGVISDGIDQHLNETSFCDALNRRALPKYWDSKYRYADYLPKPGSY